MNYAGISRGLGQQSLCKDTSLGRLGGRNLSEAEAEPDTEEFEHPQELTGGAVTRWNRSPRKRERKRDVK